MKNQSLNRVWWVVMLIALVGGAAWAQDETPAQAGEQVGVMGTFVRVAENQEGWVVLGYRAANGAVGKNWMMLDVGITLQKGVKDQTLTRDKLNLVNPAHEVLPLATQEEYGKAAGELAAMERADAMMNDSINYFPPETDQPCRIGFFADPMQRARALAFDQVDIRWRAACVGRLFFQVPGGIQLGTYNLDVKLDGSVIRVPIDIMTEEQAKEFEKKWKEAEKEAKKK
ncbi:MAG: hypothetical protein C3F15_04980 [Holophagae bacterium]|nr:MAG: hypothetical protein C3F15_04980 [Holophagae bacterium]